MSIKMDNVKFHIRVVMLLFFKKVKMPQRLTKTFAKCMETMQQVNQQFDGGLVDLRTENLIWKTNIEAGDLQNWIMMLWQQKSKKDQT